MKKILCVAVLFSFTSFCIANDDEDMNVRIAIAAAKAKADRLKKNATVKEALKEARTKASEKSVTHTYKTKDGKSVAVTETTYGKETCYSDVNKARAVAKEKGKTLILWTGITCDSHTATRDALQDCVHCHQGADSFGKGLRIETSTGTYIIPDNMIETSFPASTIKSLASNTPKTSLRRVDASQCPNGVCPTETYCDGMQNCPCPDGVCVNGTCENCPNGVCYPNAQSYVPVRQYVPTYRTWNSAPVFGGGCANGQCGR